MERGSYRGVTYRKETFVGSNPVSTLLKNTTVKRRLLELFHQCRCGRSPRLERISAVRASQDPASLVEAKQKE